MQKYYKMTEVAKIYGVSNSTVKKWCVDGDIDSTMIGGTIFIPIEATESYTNGLKSKRVIALEKQNEALQNKIAMLERIMTQVAGTLLIKGENI